MGGAALGVACRRLSRTEYEDMAREACLLLKNIGLDAVKIPSCRCKSDFGDIDLLVEGVQEKNGDIPRLFGSNLFKINGDCLSTLWKGAQLDIVFVETGALGTALGYFSWPDLGNFVGKIARAAGFKYGHKGLYRWVLTDRGKRRFGALLSTDTKSIFDFFALDHRTWELGFERPDDIYKFIASSPFFSKAPFRAEALNHASRIRNRKRPVYAGLMAWAEDTGVRDFDFKGVSSEWWEQRIDAHFGKEWRREADLWTWKESLKQLRAAKFNGRIVSELTGLSGYALGDFMRKFQDRVGDDFDSWVLKSSHDEVKEIIADQFRTIQYRE